MKKFKFALLTFMTALISVGFTACSDDDDLKNVSVPVSRSLLPH